MVRFRLFLRNSFITGVIAVLPILITFSLVKLIFHNISGFLYPYFLKLAEKFHFYLPNYVVQIVAFVIVIASIMFIGVIAKNYIGTKFLGLIESLLSRIPMVKSIYAIMRQISEAFQSKDGNNFKRVVMIEYPRREMYSVGFVTKDTSEFFNSKIGETCMSVFIPTTPNPTSGYILIVPKSQVVDLDMTVEEGIKFVISAAIVEPGDVKPLKEYVKEKEMEEAS